jgi:hypothetical protein
VHRTDLTAAARERDVKKWVVELTTNLQGKGGDGGCIMLPPGRYQMSEVWEVTYLISNGALAARPSGLSL